MKIVFDNNKQKQKFISRFCIVDLFLDQPNQCNENCAECWEKHIEMKVEEEDEHDGNC